MFRRLEKPRHFFKSSEHPGNNQGYQQGDRYCYHCKMNNHYTGECGKLKRLPIEERVDFVRSSRLCFRCLCEGHYSRDCQTTCETCGRRHHVMLHDDTRGTADHKEAQPDSTPQENQDPVEVNTYTTTSKQTSTAKVSMPVCASHCKREQL